ncbi:hypothetical protein ACROYT_G008409 [Oculina patagonica]
MLLFCDFCSEFIKVYDSNGVEAFGRRGCDSIPPGLALEIPLKSGHNITLAAQLSYKYSNVKVWYTIFNQSLSSATSVSWNVTVHNITSSSAGVRWSNFRLPLPISYYLVRYKETNGFSTLFRASSFSSSHYNSFLKGYTSYDVQVFAFTTSIGENITYSSQTISIQTPEGVPSRAPINVRATDHDLNEFVVEWEPLSLQYVNGRLLGYGVYYNQYNKLGKTVNTSTPDDSYVFLPGIQISEHYRISVAAFTSQGQGPRSPYLSLVKGCVGFANQSSGWLNLAHSGYTTLNCSVKIQSAGMRQGVALVSFQDVHIYCIPLEFIKVFDSNGIVVFGRQGCDSISPGLSVEIPLKGRQNIELAVQLPHRKSYVKVWYAIFNQSLISALLVANWTISIGSTTQTSIAIHWPNLTPILNQILLHVFGLIKDTTGNISISDILTGNATSVIFHGMSPYTQYRLSVVGVNSKGELFKSAEVTVWTKEGGMC